MFTAGQGSKNRVLPVQAACLPYMNQACVLPVQITHLGPVLQLCLCHLLVLEVGCGQPSHVGTQGLKAVCDPCLQLALDGALLRKLLQDKRKQSRAAP